MLALFVALALAGPAANAASKVCGICDYTPKGSGETQSFNYCGWVDTAGAVHLSAQRRAALNYDRNGLASLRIAGGFHYVRRDGRSAPVMAMDNWAEDFVDGRARSAFGGKVGFIDRTLKLVIPRRYDGALPFDHGRAKVCIGCTLKREGEHSEYVGGTWKMIDVQGREVR